MKRLYLATFAIALALGILCGATVAQGSNPAPILATLQRLNLWAGDAQEDPTERASRLQTIAVAVGAASDSKELSAALLTLGERESAFAKAVGEDRCHEMPRGMRCDHGRARQYWQAWRLACPELYALPAGDERATMVAAQCAATLLRWGKAVCGTWAGAFNRYAGSTCKSGPGAAREQRMKQVLDLMEHGMPWPAEPAIPR